jgi:hypothetical protein
MKYILHIELPPYTTKAKEEEIVKNLHPRLKEDYIVIVTSNCKVKILPKWRYFIGKLKNDFFIWIKIQNKRWQQKVGIYLK